MRWSDFIEATAKAVRRSPASDRYSRAQDQARLHDAVSNCDVPVPAPSVFHSVELVARLALMEEPYEAWRRGEKHHTDSEFAEIWAGNGMGFSCQYVTERLSSQRTIIDDLQTGRRTPEEILGVSVYGDTKSEIIDNLRESVATFEEALLCSGRNLSVNQTRVLQTEQSSKH